MSIGFAFPHVLTRCAGSCAAGKTYGKERRGSGGARKSAGQRKSEVCLGGLWWFHFGIWSWGFCARCAWVLSLILSPSLHSGTGGRNLGINRVARWFAVLSYLWIRALCQLPAARFPHSRFPRATRNPQTTKRKTQNPATDPYKNSQKACSALEMLHLKF